MGTPSFEVIWEDCKNRWASALARIELRELLPELGLGDDFDPDAPTESVEPTQPDPEHDDTFDPRWHDLNAAIDLGLRQLNFEADNALDDWTAHSCSLAVEAYDYLTETIGLNVRDVFRRWRQVPIVFMPGHVSNLYGASDKGSLPHLLDDAVRAYVFGAPAAAITMCRAALETVLKRHYGHGEWDRAGLEKVVALASNRYGFIKVDEIRPLVRTANRILHDCAETDRLSEEDERTILIFLKTVKSLIERAPAP